MGSIQLILLQRRIQALQECSVGKSVGEKKLVQKLVEETKKDLEVRQKSVVEEKQRQKNLTVKMEVKRKEGSCKGEEEEPDRIKDLPEELVEMIVRKLKDPKDLLSCWRSCFSFQKALERTKPVWMFHKVFPHLVHYLNQKDIMKTRQVCRGWKDQVDDFLEKVPFPDGTSSNWTYKKKLEEDWLKDKFHKTRLFFDEAQKIKNFIQQIEGNESNRPFENPIPGRRIAFQFHDDDEDEIALGEFGRVAEDYWATVIQLLEKYGKYIWDCEIVIPYMTDSSRFVTIVRDCLLHIPNVKKLCVGAADPMYTWNSKRVSSQLRTELEARPFPNLPRLVGLTLSEAPKQFTELFFPVYGEQLESLTINDYDYNTVMNTSLMEMERGLRNLSYLHLVNAENQMNLTEVGLSLLGVPLKSVRISVLNEITPFDDILEFIQQFSLTLQHVRMDYDQGGYSFFRFNHPSKSKMLKCTLKLKLPHIRMLQLSGGYNSLNYLLCMPSVEYISVKWKHEKHLRLCCQVRKGDILNVYGYLDRMYSSNIWALLPSLQKFKYQLDKEVDGDSEIGNTKVNFDEHIYTREIYDKLEMASAVEIS